MICEACLLLHDDVRVFRRLDDGEIYAQLCRACFQRWLGNEPEKFVQWKDAAVVTQKYSGIFPIKRFNGDHFAAAKTGGRR